MASDDERLRRDAAAWLARLQGPDGAAARAAFEQWRSVDPRHNDVFSRVEQSWRRSALLAQSPLVRDAALPEPRRGQRRRTPLLAAGVSAGLAMAASALFWFGPSRPPTDYVTALGEIRTLTLPDGSRVTLDTQSRISLDFSGVERRIHLESGRARFAVAHDGARPFVVTAGPARVIDRGTVFDVAYRGRAVDVLLLQGAVDVRPIYPAAPGTSQPVATTLAPGQRVTVDASPKPLAPSIAPSAARIWTTGMLAFEDSALRDVLDEANRYSATPIVIGDPELARLRVTGAFRAGAPAALARNLAALFRLRTVAASDGRIVLMPPAQTDVSKNGG